MSARPCLHCALLEAINADADEHRDGVPVIDAGHALFHIARVAAQIIASNQTEAGTIASLTVFNRSFVDGLNEAGLVAHGDVTPLSPTPSPVRH